MNVLDKTNSILDVVKKNGIDFSWPTMLVGWELGLISVKQLQEYAMGFLEKHADLINPSISEIIFSTNEYEIKSNMEKVCASMSFPLLIPGSSLWDSEKRKWRYGILRNAADQIVDAEMLLAKVERVYADFGYPKDMESFINYMPADEEVANLSPDDARMVLMQRLKDFLEQEKIELSSKIYNES